MRNIIWYYYSLKIDDYTLKNNNYILNIDNDEYIFKELTMDEIELKHIIEILNYFQIVVHEIIINNNGDLVTVFDDKNYVLIKVNKRLNNVKIDFSNYIVNDDVISIGSVWSKKVDYCMMQVRELGLNNKLLVSAFNYYVGLAENAIAISNRIRNNNVKVSYCIQHVRTSNQDTYIDYYDPTNMIIDLRIRDIAEFAKNKFFYDKCNVEMLINYINKKNFNDGELNMLFARLLFPTYFFDEFADLIVDKNENSEKVLKILRMRKNYEKFLADFYNLLYKNHNIYEIEWLKK